VVKVTVLALAIVFAGGTTPSAARDGHPVAVRIDKETINARPKAVGMAWFDYLQAKVKLLGPADPKTPASEFHVWSYQEELAARDTLARAWAAQKKLASAVQDEYLDALLQVSQAGFLHEYVWVFLRSTSWSDAPSDSRLAKFATWSAKNLSGHKVETLMDLEPGAPEK